MPKTIAWTEAMDYEIRRLRAGNASWDIIAAALGISRWATSERGRAIGARVVRLKKIVSGQPLAKIVNPTRLALPAGHPLSWGLLTQGTLLHGTAYPPPPPPAPERRA